MILSLFKVILFLFQFEPSILSTINYICILVCMGKRFKYQGFWSILRRQNLITLLQINYIFRNWTWQISLCALPYRWRRELIIDEKEIRYNFLYSNTNNSSIHNILFDLLLLPEIILRIQMACYNSICYSYRIYY